MELPDELQTALGRISAGDAQLRESFRGIERRLLLDVLREADMVGYARAFDPDRIIPGAPAHLDLVWAGMAHAIDLLSPAALIGPGIAWHPAAPEHTVWAMAFVRRCGYATLFRRYAQLVRRNLATVEVLSPIDFRFRIHGADFEATDRDSMHWHARQLQAQQTPVLKAFNRRYGDAVAAELDARVEADPLFGIRYSSSRELEECFEFQAELRAATLPGNDCLPNSARLGPLTFGDYRRVTVAGMARCFKHAAFVETLMARDPATPATLLTIHGEDRILKEEWGGLLGLDDATTSILLDVLAVTSEDLAEVRRTADCPQGLLVRAGDTFWHKPVYGGLNNPFGWVTAKLRRKFRTDWDRAVDARESEFRTDLEAIFPEPRYWFAPTTFKLRRAGQVDTDIDAIIVDRMCGTMGVFQLKWQDTFENSLAERESRSANLAKEGNTWLGKLATVSRGLTPADTAFRFGVPPSVAKVVRSNRTFILTRNAARFSGPELQDPRSAWLSWYELLRRHHRARRAPDPLSTIWRGSRRRTAVPDARASNFVVDGVNVEVVHTYGA